MMFLVNLILIKEKVYLNAYNKEHKDAQIATYDELMIKLIKDQVDTDFDEMWFMF